MTPRGPRFRVSVVLALSVGVALFASASASALRVVRYRSTTTFSFADVEGDGTPSNLDLMDAFQGKVSSSKAACLSNRGVRVLRSVPGTDPVVASSVTPTASDGTWSVPFEDPGEGDYYAVVARKVVKRTPTVKKLCRTTTSAVVHVVDDQFVDVTPPTVTNVTSSAANGSYVAGSIVPVQVVFSEQLIVTGTPQLTLETGATDAIVDYTSGSTTDTLTFNYTVAAGHASSDLDYTSVSALSVNGGTITDATGNDATLTLPSPGDPGSLGANKAIVADGVAPTVTNVTTPVADGSYGLGSGISVRVVFSETVFVTGIPNLTLETGATDAIVNLTTGSGTNTLTFVYTVASGHTSPDLDYTSTTALALNGGTIRDGAGNDATLTLASPGSVGSLGANKAIVVDGVRPTVTNVTSSANNGLYGIGDVIPVQVVFSEIVFVTGIPNLTLETGPTSAVVDLTSGSGTNTLTFNYTVASGHNSSDLEYTHPGAGGGEPLNGGTITDAAGNVATRTLPSPGTAGSLGANKQIVVDGVAPTVTNVTSTAANGSYGIGSVIPVQVVFSETVFVTGIPNLTLETGGTDAVVDQTSGSGTNTLTFNYTVASGHTSPDLDYTSVSALALNGGTIGDAVNDATLTLASPGASGSLGASKAIVIETVAPTVTNVTSTASNDSRYGIGSVIPVQVVFSETVLVTGIPNLTLETGSIDAVVAYTSGAGTNTLTFNYTVASGHTSPDLDYTSVSALALNGGTIRDAAGNNATLTLASPGATGSLGANKAIIVDGVAPTVTNVTSTVADGSYGIGSVIPVQVVFSEPVIVNTAPGTPRLTLETGATDALANYSSGEATNTLTFNYTVASGHTSPDLDYTSVSALALNGGTIRDLSGNHATLTLPTPGGPGSLGANKNIMITG